MKLKILAGLHAGAVVELKSPATVLGRDAQCDVILTDESVEPLHLLLLVKDGRVRVRLLTTHPAWLGDDPLLQEEDWQPGIYLSLQGVRLELLDDAAEPPSLKGEGQTSTPEPDDGGWSETVMSDPPAIVEAITSSSKRSWPVRGAGSKPRRSKAETGLSGWNTRTASGVVCLCLAVTVLGVTFREISASPSTPVATAQAWNPAQLARRLDTEAFKGLKTTVDSAGISVVTGYVADDEALQDLRSRLEGPVREGRVRLRVDTLTNLAKTLGQQIDDPGIKARFVSPQRLELWGVATREATKSKIIRLQHEFASDFEIEPRISYEGVVKAKTEPVPEKAPLQIAHVSGGVQPSIVTQGGEQYFKGARLEDGTEVVSITTDKVLLRQGEKVVEYRFE